MNRREQRQILKAERKKKEEEEIKIDLEKIKRWKIEPELKKTVLEAYKDGIPVYYNKKHELFQVATVSIGWPLASRVFAAISGFLLAIS